MPARRVRRCYGLAVGDCDCRHGPAVDEDAVQTSVVGCRPAARGVKGHDRTLSSRHCRSGEPEITCIRLIVRACAHYPRKQRFAALVHIAQQVGARWAPTVGAGAPPRITTRRSTDPLFPSLPAPLEADGVATVGQGLGGLADASFRTPVRFAKQFSTFSPVSRKLRAAGSGKPQPARVYAVRDPPRSGCRHNPADVTIKCPRAR
jgi:hypothetical protein